MVFHGTLRAVEELEAHLRANPEDRGAWTVYGDWLLEHGDVRGELVRSQRELTKEERARWRGPVPERFITGWRHGFVTAVELPFDVRSPVMLERLLHDPASRLLSSVIASPASRGFADVDDDFTKIATDGLPIDAISSLLALDLSRLRTFGLPYLPLSDGHVADLIAAKLAVSELDLRYSELTDAQLERLIAAPWFAGVRRLHLQRTALTAASSALLASRRFAWLDIRDTALDPAVLAPSVDRLISYGDRALAGPRSSARVPAKLAAGLTLSPQRTERFTAPRILDKRSLSRTFTKDCARVPDMPGFIVVYVDPDEWTFRTYENILPLDRLISAPDLALADHVELAHEVHRFTLRGELPAFDDLPLYTEPLNKGTRGGKRYIFHAAALAESLTRAIKTALPDLPGFSHVNPVFRCNRFEPGDEPFQPHLDTPYHDAARDQISQFTLLIYLTGGSASPALQIENLAIDTIEAMQCFVFHQAYEHAGAAYADTRKVFLRSELIFEGVEVASDPRIAALFSKACYLTGESIRDAELARDADRAYNAVAAAHWSRVLPPPAEPYLHKQFAGIHWLANGYDFWFPRALPLADCAAITLLDYFNCQLDGAAFRTLARSEVVRDIDPEGFVAALPQPQLLPALDKDALFLPAERLGSCCPGHASLTWIATRSDEVVELYLRAQTFCRARIDPAPIVMLGQQVLLDPSRFQIAGNQIHVLSSERLAPVNFAACWNCLSSPRNYVDIDCRLDVLQPLVPPILWEATPATHHLMFDFFRNGWVDQRSYQLAIPKIRIDDFETVDENDDPWLDASRSVPIDDRHLPRAVQYPFWAHYMRTALIRELYKDRPAR